MQCQICKENTKSRKALAIHINNKHPETTKEEYYINYISINNEHICKTCGKTNTFRGFAKGFGTYCSPKCMSNSNEVRNKKKSTLVEKYGVTNISQIDAVKTKKKEINIEKYGVEYAFQATEIKEKNKETLMERYGVDNAMKVDSVKDKLKATMVERYGVENARQCPEISDRAKKTNLEKYGKEYYSQTEDYKIQIKETCMENFGVEHQMHSEEVKDKVKSTNMDRYGVDNPLKLKEVQDKVKATNLDKYGVEYPIQNSTIKEKSKIATWRNFYNKLINSDRLKNKVTPLFKIEDYIGSYCKNKYDFKCVQCNHIFEDYIDSGRIPRCYNCYPVIMSNPRTSKGENEVYEFVKSILPENTIIIQNDRSLIKPLELDIYIPSHKLAIEFNGLYWHSEKQGKDQYYHFNKYSKCREKDIDLIQIFDDEWFNKQDIICSIIADKLKVYENTYNANDLNINKVPFKEAELFLDQNHIQGSTHRGFNYGLYDSNNNLISMITVIRSKDNYEILRFCTKLNTNVVGGFQKLINNFTKDIKGSIITYTDLRYGYGNVYENSGFNRMTSSSPNYFYTNDYINRDSRFKFQKHKLNNLLESFDPTLTEWQNMQNNEYDRIWDCGNNVFEMKVA